MRLGILVLVGLLLGSDVPLAIAVNCYYCTYSENNGTRGGDPQCQFGHSIPDKFLVECTENTSLPVRNAQPGDDLLRQTLWGCGKININGGGERQVEIQRGCVAIQGVEGACQEQSVDAWKQGSDAWSQLVSEIAQKYADDSVARACYCVGDGCNAGPKTRDGKDGASCTQGTLVSLLLSGMLLMMWISDVN